MGPIRPSRGHRGDTKEGLVGEGSDSAGPFELFAAELRKVLQHLYDPADLRKSPLLDILAADHHRSPLAALRAVLTEAIQELKPGGHVPQHANAWRIYHVLTYRYLEQSSQREVAADLSLSIRQLRRQEQAAVEVLADHLWTRYDLESKPERLSALYAEPSVPSDVGEGPTGGRAQEIEWLRKSFPSEIVDIADLIGTAVSTVDPLFQGLAVRVSCRMPEDLPPVAGQLAPLRQALLTVLTAAGRSVPGGEVRVAAEADRKGLCLRIQAHTAGHPLSVSGELGEKVDMARELIQLFGGSLEPPLLEQGGRCLTTTLLLIVAEQIPVLVVDDNVDTLHLFERYFSASRYRFVGTDDPEQALLLAEELSPEAIILDVMLPGVDGWELLGRFREHPAIRDVPILTCTILPQEQLALALGATLYVSKPVRRQQFVQALGQALNQAATRVPTSPVNNATAY